MLGGGQMMKARTAWYISTSLPVISSEAGLAARLARRSGLVVDAFAPHTAASV
jgi:hypothetical protein